MTKEFWFEVEREMLAIAQDATRGKIERREAGKKAFEAAQNVRNAKWK